MRLLRPRAGQPLSVLVLAGTVILAKAAFAQPANPTPPADPTTPPAGSAAPPATNTAPPAPPATATAPANTAPAHTTAPAATTAAPAASATPAKKEPEAKPYVPPKSAIGPEFGMGVAARVSDFPTHTSFNNRTGVAWHAGLMYGLNRQWAVGLQYAMNQAGDQQSLAQNGANESDVQRNLHSLFAEVRAMPLPRNNNLIRFYVSMMLGMSWERASGEFVAPTGSANNPAARPNFNNVTYAGGSDPGFAFGAGLGADIELGGGAAVLLRTGFTFHGVGDGRLSSDPQGRVLGGGFTTMFDTQLAFQYRFDVTPKR